MVNRGRGLKFWGRKIQILKKWGWGRISGSSELYTPLKRRAGMTDVK